MKKLLMVLALSLFLIGSVYAFTLFLGSHEVDFSDGSHYIISKSFNSEKIGNSVHSQKTLLISGDLEDVKVCIIRENHRKCV